MAMLTEAAALRWCSSTARERLPRGRGSPSLTRPLLGCSRPPSSMVAEVLPMAWLQPGRCTRSPIRPYGRGCPVGNRRLSARRGVLKPVNIALLSTNGAVAGPAIASAWWLVESVDAAKLRRRGYTARESRPPGRGSPLLIRPPSEHGVPPLVAVVEAFSVAWLRSGRRTHSPSRLRWRGCPAGKRRPSARHEMPTLFDGLLLSLGYVCSRPLLL